MTILKLNYFNKLVIVALLFFRDSLSMDLVDNSTLYSGHVVVNKRKLEDVLKFPFFIGLDINKTITHSGRFFLVIHGGSDEGRNAVVLCKSSTTGFKIIKTFDFTQTRWAIQGADFTSDDQNIRFFLRLKNSKDFRHDKVLFVSIADCLKLYY